MNHHDALLAAVPMGLLIALVGMYLLLRGTKSDPDLLAGRAQGGPSGLRDLDPERDDDGAETTP